VTAPTKDIVVETPDIDEDELFSEDAEVEEEEESEEASPPELEVVEEAEKERVANNEERDHYRGWDIVTREIVAETRLKGVGMKGRAITNSIATMLGREGAIRLTVQGGYVDAITETKRLIDRKIAEEYSVEAVVRAHPAVVAPPEEKPKRKPRQKKADPATPATAANPWAWGLGPDRVVNVPRHTDEISEAYSASKMASKEGGIKKPFYYGGRMYTTMGVSYLGDAYTAWCWELVRPYEYEGPMASTGNSASYEGIKVHQGKEEYVLTRPMAFIVPGKEKQ
jgi:hypothetical protein